MDYLFGRADPSNLRAYGIFPLKRGRLRFWEVGVLIVPSMVNEPGETEGTEHCQTVLDKLFLGWGKV
jgi:hypothetical protein